MVVSFDEDLDLILDGPMRYPLDVFLHSREGAKFIGPHHWHSDGRAKSFRGAKNDGANTFPGEKNEGAETF